MDLEATNRERVALGLAPIPVPGAPSSNLKFKDKDASDSEEEASTMETRQAAAGDNWLSLKKEQDEKRRREERFTHLKKEREAAQRVAKLDGKGLGESDGPEMSTRAWLMGAGKRKKEIEKKRAKASAKEAAENMPKTYTSRDLAGAKIGHEMGAFDDGEEQILTLKDAPVDADSDEGDELENINLRETEKLKERQQLKKQKPVYDPNDLNEDASQSVLSKYDEEIEGKKRKTFTLGSNGAPERLVRASGEAAHIPGRTKISLDFLAEDRQPISDYQDISELKIKKPKKKKKEKSKRSKGDPEQDDEGVPGAPEIETKMEGVAANGGSSSSTKRKRDDDFDVDDDLQSRLATSRKAALQKRKKMSPEELLRELGPEEHDDYQQMDTDEEEGGFLFDETSRFVENLDVEQARRKVHEEKMRAEASLQAEENGDMDIDDEVPTQVEHIKKEDQDQGEALAGPETNMSTTGLQSEESLNGGVGATLKLLRQRGLIGRDNTSSGEHDKFRTRQRFLADMHARTDAAEAKARAARERDRASGRLDRMTPREREVYAQEQNLARDRNEARAAAQQFDAEYRPNINLKYNDEYGRALGPKEAFKHLSHQFHGKGSGKGKTEKKLKRIEEERAREAASGLSGGAKFRGNEEAAKQRGQAGVRLQ